MHYKNYVIVLIIASMILLVSCTGKNDVKFTEEHNPPSPQLLHSGNLEQGLDPIPIMDQIKQMSLKEKIGQMVIVGFEGQKMTKQLKELIEVHRVGGLILYNRNMTDAKQTLQLLNDIKERNVTGLPLFLSVDQEDGKVNRLPNIDEMPTSLKIGMGDDPTLSFTFGEILGQQLAAFGMNMNYAPVLDIFSNPANRVIGDRAFGTTDEVVTEHGVQVLKGMQSENIISVVKHFPGHGDTIADSHFELPIVVKSKAELHAFEWLPFIEAIDNDADAVMIAHILTTQIDKHWPATLSKVIITDVLREELGFTGVVITDDMTMGAITQYYDIGEAAILAVNAGIDIVMIAHGFKNVVNTLELLEEAVRTGVIQQETVDNSVYRILELKQKYKLTNETIDTIQLEHINDDIKALISELDAS